MQPLHHSRAQRSIYQFAKAREAIASMDRGAEERAVSFDLIPGLIVALARLRDDDRLWDGPRLAAEFATRNSIQAVVTALSNARQDMVEDAAIDLDPSREAITLTADLAERIKLGLLSYDADRHEDSIRVFDLAARVVDGYRPSPALA